MFISFEGIDSCGKSTQAKLLEENLRNKEHEVLSVREPGNTRLSEAIRAILLDKENNDMTARTELLLFNSSRAQLVETVLRPALASGTVVICDRFADSSVAYQSFGRKLPLKDVEESCRIATDGLQPNVTFYLHISLEEAERRAKLDQKKADRMEISGKEFFERVLDGYEYLAKTHTNRFIRLDGTKSVEELEEEIWTIVVDKIFDSE